MKAAIVASSRPASGRRPRLHRAVEFRWGEKRDVVMTYRNSGVLSFHDETLVLSRDIIAAAQLPDEIARPYAVHAAHILEGRGAIARVMLALPILGELTALALAYGPSRTVAHEALAGCALVYENDAAIPVSLLLCGLASDIAMVMDEIPPERRHDELPPPFEIGILRSISDKFAAMQRYEY